MFTQSTETKPEMTKPVVAGSYGDFMACAYAMELEAAERYTEFAERLEMHNNPEVARLFRKLAEIEGQHARQILAKMGWASVPALPPAFAWEGNEGPETAQFDSLHHLMHPFHALGIALRCEIQAQKYFEKIASGAAPQSVRSAAAEMATEEREHVKLIQNWLARVPRPLSGWE
jgi:rubrerythrin